MQKNCLFLPSLKRTNFQVIIPVHLVERDDYNLPFPETRTHLQTVKTGDKNKILHNFGVCDLLVTSLK